MRRRISHKPWTLHRLAASANFLSAIEGTIHHSSPTNLAWLFNSFTFANSVIRCGVSALQVIISYFALQIKITDLNQIFRPYSNQPAKTRWNGLEQQSLHFLQFVAFATSLCRNDRSRVVLTGANKLWLAASGFQRVTRVCCQNSFFFICKLYMVCCVRGTQIWVEWFRSIDMFLKKKKKKV